MGSHWLRQLFSKALGGFARHADGARGLARVAVALTDMLGSSLQARPLRP